MAVNYVDYDVLAQGQAVYSSQADAIADMMTRLASMNESLAGGWQNNAATSFINMYNEKYAPALKTVQEALSDISTTISKYINAQKERDASDAAMLNG